MKTLRSKTHDLDAAHVVIADLKEALTFIHYCLENDTETDDGQDGKDHASLVCVKAIELINGYNFIREHSNQRGMYDA